MTQIALDPDSALRTVDQLRHLNGVVAGQRGNALRAPAGFPAGLAASTMAEQNAIVGGMDAGRGAIDNIANGLAQRTTQFVIAGGGSVPKGFWGRLAKFSRSHSVGSWVQRVIGLHDAWGHGISTIKTGALAIGNTMRKLAGSRSFTVKSMDRWLKSAKNPANKFFRLVEKFEKSPLGRGLHYASVLNTYYQAYRNSSASTPVGKFTSALLGGSFSWVIGKNPVAATLDWAGGGLVTGSLEAVTILGEEGYFLVTGDHRRMGESAERFSDNAQAGKYGWWMQAWNAEGELLSGALTGDSDAVNQWTQEAREGKHGGVMQFLNAEGEALSSLGYSMISGNTSSMDDFSEDALKGEHGPVVKGISKAGNWLGGAIYDTFN